MKKQTTTVTASKSSKSRQTVRRAAKPAVIVCSKCGRENGRDAAHADCRNVAACKSRRAAARASASA